MKKFVCRHDTGYISDCNLSLHIQAGGTWMINFPHQHGAMKFNILHEHADTLLFLYYVDLDLI